MCVFFLKKMGTKFDTYAAFHTLNVLLRSEKSNMQSTILVAKRMIFFFFSEHKMSLFQKIIIYNLYVVFKNLEGYVGLLENLRENMRKRKVEENKIKNRFEVNKLFLYIFSNSFNLFCLHYIKIE